MAHVLAPRTFVRVFLLAIILKIEAFAPFVKREHMPGAGVRSEEDIKAYIRQWSKTDYHPVGTCKMGDDELAVVDTDLRVHGLEGLRVIDASIMPTLISGNTSAPSVMIGEKGADHILRGASRPVAVSGAAG